MLKTNRWVWVGFLASVVVSAVSVSALVAQDAERDEEDSDRGAAVAASSRRERETEERERRRRNEDDVTVDDRNGERRGRLPASDTKDITWEQADAVIQACIREARRAQTQPMDIAVVDAGGNLKAFARMDHAWLGSIDIAIKKAKTARYFDLPTEKIGELSQPGGPLYGIEHSNEGLITFPGGIPLTTDDGVVIGGVGVSGDSVENDRRVAEAGVRALRS